MFRIIFSLLLMAGAAAAEVGKDVARVDLLPGWRQADGSHVAALKISLAPGWKTYWRAPGDAGIPPQFDWSGSENLATARTIWPRPELFRLNGLRTIGYDGVVVLPMAFGPVRAGQDIVLKGQIEFGVCETVCIPIEARVSGALPAGVSQPDPAIRAALADVPETASAEMQCALSPIADGMRLSATVRIPRLGRDEAAVIELPDAEVWVSEVDVRRRGGVLVAEADLVPPQGAPFAVDRSSLRLTLLSQGRAVEMRGCAPG